MLQSDPLTRQRDGKVVGLIMAGGRSQRMHSTLGSTHKALISILGVPMLERNICCLVAKGIHHIVVALGAHEKKIEEFVNSRGRSIVTSVAGSIACLKEEQPLGTIGAAREMRGQCSDLIVTNVDNLTSLDWQQMLAHHRQKGVAMTIAAHWQPFRMPLGELEVGNGDVIAYHEKSTRPILISSGAYVLSPQACAAIPEGQRTDVPDLVNTLLRSGQPVAAFEHNAAWIDVNDAASIGDAETLVASHFNEFARWHPSPQIGKLKLIVRSNLGILAEATPSEFPSAYQQWDLPGNSSLPPTQKGALAFCRQIGFTGLEPRFLGACDELGEDELVTRHHIFVVDLPAQSMNTLPAQFAWVPADHREIPGGASPLLRRSLTLLRRLQ